MARYGQYTLARVEISDGRFDAALAVAIGPRRTTPPLRPSSSCPSWWRRRCAPVVATVLGREALSGWAQAAERMGPWLGACARALVSDGAMLTRRIATLLTTRTNPVVVDLRSHLLFGELAAAPSVARRPPPPRDRHEMFLAWCRRLAERAGSELVATVHRPPPDPCHAST
jgi:hypothetical protein